MKPGTGLVDGPGPSGEMLVAVLDTSLMAAFYHAWQVQGAASKEM